MISAIWAVWFFAWGAAGGALVTVALWLSRGGRLQRVFNLADLADGIARSEQQEQESGDEGEAGA